MMPRRSPREPCPLWKDGLPIASCNELARQADRSPRNAERRVDRGLNCWLLRLTNEGVAKSPAMPGKVRTKEFPNISARLRRA